MVQHTAPQPSHAPAVRELGRYRLLRHLATGGMGEVYLAEAQGAAGFAKRVVVKTVREDLARDPELVRQFVEEGRLLEALDHPNIAQILDLGVAGETYFLAIELVEGYDLRALQRALPHDVEGLQRTGEAAALYVVSCVAHALDHAQSRRGPDGRPLRIVHHDVTPSNVMVRRDGHVKLVDFGVARSVLAGRMAPGFLRGKLPYLSPEHARQLRIDGRADLFALGLVAFELLSGKRALDVAEPEALELGYAQLPDKIAALAAGQAMQVATLALLHKLTALEADARPANAAAVAVEADRALVDLGEASPARHLATMLGPAFDVLEARSRTFDQTLAQMVSVAGPTQQDATGTLSLPGVEAVVIAAESARSDPTAPPPPRLHKRVVTAAVLLLGLTGGAGWWLGARGRNAPAVPVAAIARGGAAAAGSPVVPGRPPMELLPPAASPTRTSAAISGLPQPVTIATAHAVQPNDDVTAATDDAASIGKPSKERDSKLATVTFRVQPVDCLVRVDGHLQRADSGNAYVLRLPPGDHELVVRDPGSGLAKTVRLEGLRSGETRPLLGGVCIGPDCL
jgi:hypothetical protein